MVRGDVFSVELPKGRGRVQRGKRFAVVVQADDLLSLSTIIICPSSSSAPAASFHPEVEISGSATRVMCEMAGAVDASRLGKRVGHVTHDEMRAIDAALELVLDLGR